MGRGTLFDVTVCNGLSVTVTVCHAISFAFARLTDSLRGLDRDHRPNSQKGLHGVHAAVDHLVYKLGGDFQPLVP